jgi:hypothetical protein
MGGLVEQAKSLVAQYEETGEEVPPELQALADSRALLGASDEAAGGEENA